MHHAAHSHCSWSRMLLLRHMWYVHWTCKQDLHMPAQPALLPPMLHVTNSLLCVDFVGAFRDLAGSKQHQQLAPLAATLYYYAAFASAATAAGRSAAAASGAAATAAAAEVGSCGSNGDAPTAAGAGKGKRRSSTTDISGATPAATAGGNGEVAGGDVDSEDELLQLPRKRSRVMGPAGQLLMFLQTDPERWVSVVGHVHQMAYCLYSSTQYSSNK